MQLVCHTQFLYPTLQKKRRVLPLQGTKSVTAKGAKWAKWAKWALARKLLGYFFKKMASNSKMDQSGI